MNQLKWLLSTIVILTAAFFPGCAPIYLHSSPNTPMLDEQGDAKISLRGGISGGELQGAYAVSDHMYLFGGLMGSEEEREDEIEPSSHRYFELGAGTMWRPVQNLVLEGSGGLGLGSGKGTARITLGESTVYRHSEGGYFKPFLQGNIAFQTRVVDIGFVNRLSLIQFNEIREIGSSPEINSDPSGPVFWEPSVFMQLGWDRIKLSIQAGSTSPLIGEPDFDYIFMNVSFGVSYQFNVR